MALLPFCPLPIEATKRRDPRAHRRRGLGLLDQSLAVVALGSLAECERGVSVTNDPDGA